jgi:hypothetical protein
MKEIDDQFLWRDKASNAFNQNCGPKYCADRCSTIKISFGNLFEEIFVSI